MIITAQAPGKLVLFGEYAVLENAPALVTAVDRRCTVRLADSPEDYSVLELQNLPVEPFTFRLINGRLQRESEPEETSEDALSLFTGVFESLCRNLADRGVETSPMHISIDTTPLYHPVGQKLGLGASAAITVALTAALFGYHEMVDPDTEAFVPEVFQSALLAHRAAQGTGGSGIDIAASAYGGTLRYRRPTPGESTPAIVDSLSPPAALRMLPIWSGRSASTPELLEKLAGLQGRAPQQYRSIMDEMTGLTEVAGEAYATGEVAAFLNHVDSFFALLYKLGRLMEVQIISPAHTGIAALVRQNGGHYKPSGAGRGDIGLAFTTSAEVTAHIREKIAGSAFELVELTPDAPGVTFNSEIEV